MGGYEEVKAKNRAKLRKEIVLNVEYDGLRRWLCLCGFANSDFN